ncbi:MAG: ATP-binding cassette domain-containing protein [Slackia sp.]|nr:ATP-binding cassette domain-containing protein [Slackia sp.]
MRPLLSIQDLSKSFVLHNVGRTVAGCSHIDLDIMPGQFVGITGRSGSGKSTILRCIYRTNLPESGRILYDSDAFGPIDLCTADERRILYLRKNEIGYVSQFLDALPRQSAYDIVLKSALETFGSHDAVRAHGETRAMLRHFNIDENHWELFPRTFSGGEKLRLNIAAAMIKRPRLLLLDEPTASLDNASKVKVRELIEQLKSQGTTMLGIFHDLEFMEGLCDKEFNMQKGMMS